MRSHSNSYISFGNPDVKKIPFLFSNLVEVEEKVAERNAFDLTVMVGSITVGGFSSPDASEINATEIRTLVARDLFPESEIYSFYEYANDIDFLNKKFDELKEKEIDGTITNFEKVLLHIVETQILKLPNPLVDQEHKEAMEEVKKFQLLKSQFNQKYSSRLINKLSGLFSWLF